MLQNVEKDRLDKVLAVIKKAKIRFPVAELGDRLKADKGMVSAYLNGKKPISGKFYSNFIQEFGEDTDLIEDSTNSEKIAAQEAAIRVIFLELVNLKHLVR